MLQLLEDLQREVGVSSKTSKVSTLNKVPHLSPLSWSVSPPCDRLSLSVSALVARRWR